MIEIRELRPAGLAHLAEIDRSEEIDVAYELENGALQRRSVEWHVPPWDSEGTNEHAIPHFKASLAPILDRGGMLFGAMEGEVAAGVAVVEPRFQPPMAWLTFMHVSRPYRRRGLAARLWDECMRVAADAGAEVMYVSATPTGSAVGFYLSRGATLARPPHPDLFADEPEDIHLVCTID